MEERLDGRVRAGERGRVRARRRVRPRVVVPLFIARIGFLRATRPRDAARTCAGCRTTRGRAATSSVLSSSSQYSSRSFDETSALLPIETNDEKPRPRSDAFSSSASPSAPLCDENPIVPGRERARPEGRVQRGRGDGDAEAVRADEARRRARGRARAAAPGARGPPRRSRRSRPRSRRARGPAFAQRRLAPRRARCVARHADHGEVDLRRARPRSTSTPRTPATGSPVAVDRVRGALEVGARGCSGRARRRSTRGATTRRSRRRVAGDEERAQRGDDGDVVALLDALAVGVGRARSGSATSKSPRVERARDAEACVLEDAHHGRVLAPSPRRRSARSPTAAARSASCSSSRVPMPRPCWSSATVNATSAVVGSRSRA